MALRNLSWFTNGCAGHEKRGCNFPRQYWLISTKTSLMEAFKAQSNLKVRLNVSCSLWMDTLKFKRGSGYYTTALLLYCPQTSFGEKRVKFNRSTRKRKTFFEPTWRPWAKKNKNGKESLECADVEVFVREPLSSDLSSLSNPHMTGLTHRC